MPFDCIFCEYYTTYFSFVNARGLGVFQCIFHDLLVFIGVFCCGSLEHMFSLSSPCAEFNIRGILNISSDICRFVIRLVADGISQSASVNRRFIFCVSFCGQANSFQTSLFRTLQSGKHFFGVVSECVTHYILFFIIAFFIKFAISVFVKNILWNATQKHWAKVYFFVLVFFYGVIILLPLIVITFAKKNTTIT